MDTNNLGFLRGLQANLNKLDTYQPGYFYLTSDTNRLYVAQTEDNLVELNQSIQVVNSVRDLPLTKSSTNSVEVGQFYYIVGETSTDDKNAGYPVVQGNILVVCTAIGEGENGQITWTQINPDTNDNDIVYVSGLTIQKKEIDSNNNIITYDIVLEQEIETDGKKDPFYLDTSLDEEGKPKNTKVVGTLTISGADLASITTDISVGLQGELNAANDTLTLSTAGAGSDAVQTVKLVAGENISYYNDNDSIVINAVGGSNPLAVQESSKGVELYVDTNGEQKYIGLDGGNKINISANKVSAEGEDEITGLTINHSSLTTNEKNQVSKEVFESDQSVEVVAQDSFSFTVVDEVVVDDYGHTIEVKYKKIGGGIQSPNPITINKDTGEITYSLTDPMGQTKEIELEEGESNPTIGMKIGVDGKAAAFIPNGQSLGDFYSKEAIDRMVRGLNAMTYRGNVDGTTSKLPSIETKAIHIGDTYMVKESFVLGDTYCYPGDLIIATGDEFETDPEDASNKIETDYIAQNLVWEVIPAGNQDTTYDFSFEPTYPTEENGNTKSVTLNVSPSTGNGTDTIASFVEGSDIQLAFDDTNKNITIAHKKLLGNDSSTSIGQNSTNSSDQIYHLDNSTNKTFKIPSFSVNENGHITSAKDVTLQLPDVNEYDLQVASTEDGQGADKTITYQPGITLVSDGKTSTINFESEDSASNPITITGSKDTITITHNATLDAAKNNVGQTAKNSTPVDILGFGETFNVPVVSVNEYGHITELHSQTLTLPTPEISLTPAIQQAVGDKTTVGISATLNVNGAESGALSYNLVSTSNSLLLEKEEKDSNTNIQMKLVWGTF